MSQTVEHQTSFQNHLDGVNLARARFGYWLVALLMPAGVTLDWFTHADWLSEFAIIRLGTSGAALLCLWITYAGPWAERSIVLQTLPALIAAAGVEFMVIPLGPATSQYYAGLCLCIVALAVLHTWRWPRVLGLSAAIVLMWLAPALPELIRGEAAWSVFYNNLYFLVLTTAIAVPSTQMRYRSARREFDAREALAKTSIELADALKRAQEVDRMKSEFFANITHELRTPLTLIVSPVDALLATLAPGADRDALKVVRRNASRLFRMIDDLLDLAKLEGGGLRLRVEQVDLRDLVEQVVRQRPTGGERQRYRAFVRFDGEPSRHVRRSTPLEIVLTNLLGNAMKFTPSGGRIDVCGVRQRPDGTSVEIADTGPGISHEEQAADLRALPPSGDAPSGGIRGRGHRPGAGTTSSRNSTVARFPWRASSVRDRRSLSSCKRGTDHFDTEVMERRHVQTWMHPGRRTEDRLGRALTRTG